MRRFNAATHAEVVNRWLHIFSFFFVFFFFGFCMEILQGIQLYIVKMVCWIDQWDTFMGWLKANAIPFPLCLPSMWIVSYASMLFVQKKKSTFPFESNLLITMRWLYSFNKTFNTLQLAIFLKRIFFFGLSLFQQNPLILFQIQHGIYLLFIFLLFLNSHRLKNKNHSSDAAWNEHLKFIFTFSSFFFSSLLSIRLLHSAHAQYLDRNIKQSTIYLWTFCSKIWFTKRNNTLISIHSNPQSECGCIEQMVFQFSFRFPVRGVTEWKKELKADSPRILNMKNGERNQRNGEFWVL